MEKICYTINSLVIRGIFMSHRFWFCRNSLDLAYVFISVLSHFVKHIQGEEVHCVWGQPDGTLQDLSSLQQDMQPWQKGSRHTVACWAELCSLWAFTEMEQSTLCGQYTSWKPVSLCCCCLHRILICSDQEGGKWYSLLVMVRVK